MPQCSPMELSLPVSVSVCLSPKEFSCLWRFFGMAFRFTHMFPRRSRKVSSGTTGLSSPHKWRRVWTHTESIEYAPKHLSMITKRGKKTASVFHDFHVSVKYIDYKIYWLVYIKNTFKYILKLNITDTVRVLAFNIFIALSEKCSHNNLCHSPEEVMQYGQNIFGTDKVWLIIFILILIFLTYNRFCCFSQSYQGKPCDKTHCYKPKCLVPDLAFSYVVSGQFSPVRQS